MNAYSPYLDDYNYFDAPKLESYDIGTDVSSQDIYELDADFDITLKTLSTSNISVDVYTNQTIGTGQIADNSASALWDNLSADSPYWWYANIITSSGDIYHTDLNQIQASQVNQAPVAKNPVPTQNIIGTDTVSFSASDIAQDLDLEDILTVTQIVTTPDSAIARVELDNDRVSVTGVAAGSTTVIVLVSDGTDSIEVEVPIQVIDAQAPTYELSITAGAGGTITTGQSGKLCRRDGHQYRGDTR
jgi:hypothetical protein